MNETQTKTLEAAIKALSGYTSSLTQDERKLLLPHSKHPNIPDSIPPHLTLWKHHADSAAWSVLLQSITRTGAFYPQDDIKPFLKRLGEIEGILAAHGLMPKQSPLTTREKAEILHAAVAPADDSVPPVAVEQSQSAKDSDVVQLHRIKTHKLFSVNEASQHNLWLIRRIDETDPAITRIVIRDSEGLIGTPWNFWMANCHTRYFTRDVMLLWEEADASIRGRTGKTRTRPRKPILSPPKQGD